jgi:hypothetical protein
MPVVNSRIRATDYLQDIINKTHLNTLSSGGIRDPLIRKSLVSRIAQSHLPGDVGAYNRLGLAPNSNLTRYAGKNYGDISFMEGKPHFGYGNIGLMTTPSKIKGPISTLGAHQPNFMGKYPEMHAYPTWFKNREGLFSHMKLPTAKGRVVYNPDVSYSPEIMRNLEKLEALPVDSKFLRNLGRLNKEVPHNPYRNFEPGNIGYDGIMENFPKVYPRLQNRLDEVIEPLLPLR